MKTLTRKKVNEFIAKYKHGLLLLYFLIYLPWFGYLEENVTTHFHVIHVALDDKIPFCEYFIIPYMLWFAYVAWGVAYFFFKNTKVITIPIFNHYHLPCNFYRIPERTLPSSNHF